MGKHGVSVERLTVRILFGLTLILLASGCETNHVVKDGHCLTCINNPLTGKPINHDGSLTNNETQQTQSNNSVSAVNKFSLAVPVDVDLSYARLKRHFGYRTKEEIKDDPEWNALRSEFLFKSGTYRHEIVPGASYTIREEIIPYKNINKYKVVEMYIERLSDEKSSIEVAYSNNDLAVSKEQFEIDLESSIRRALKL